MQNPITDVRAKDSRLKFKYIKCIIVCYLLYNIIFQRILNIFVQQRNISVFLISEVAFVQAERVSNSIMELSLNVQFIIPDKK